MANELIPIPKNEIVVYKPDAMMRLQVRVQDESVWLTQPRLGELFGVDRSVINKHIKNIYKSGELDDVSTCAKIAQVQIEGGRQIKRTQPFYNLDVIIAVGYRVNSKLATRFRQWATSVLKEYLLRRAIVNRSQEMLAAEMDRRFAGHEKRIAAVEQSVDAIVKYALPAPEQVFVNGQFLDAHVELLKIVRLAKKRIVLIDNFIDERVFTLLARRKDGVVCTIYSRSANKRDIQLAAARYAQQYPAKPITLIHTPKSHDRFFVIDDMVWQVGASPKDAGARIFSLIKMKLPAAFILGLVP